MEADGRKQIARDGERWAAKPVQAAGLRLFVMLAPVGAALTTATLVAPLLPAAGTTGERMLWWLVLCLASTGPLFLTHRVVRRLLPLSSLLRLSMQFPGRAPSRLKMAGRAASVRNLQQRAEEARREGIADEPTRAAETILTLITALSQHDPRTRGHSERVHLYVELLAKELGLSEGERSRLRWAALVHDIGKMGIPASLLNKPGPLDGPEWEEIKRHPIEGARLCIPIREWLGEWALAVEEHHERWDGGGYPRGLAGTEISRAARIVGVADAYETMTAARPYKKPLTAVAAREELAKGAGTQFDPHVVRAFLNISLRRLWWSTGAMSWIAQWPVVGQLPRLGEAVAVSTATVAGAATLAAGGFVQPGHASFDSWGQLPRPRVEAVEDIEVLPQVYERPGPGPTPAAQRSNGTMGREDPLELSGPLDSGDRDLQGHTEAEPPGRQPSAAPAGAAENGWAKRGPAPRAPAAWPPSGVTLPDGVPGRPPELFPGRVPEDRPGNVPRQVEPPAQSPDAVPGQGRRG